MYLVTTWAGTAIRIFPSLNRAKLWMTYPRSAPYPCARKVVRIPLGTSHPSSQMTRVTVAFCHWNHETGEVSWMEVNDITTTKNPDTDFTLPPDTLSDMIEEFITLLCDGDPIAVDAMQDILTHRRLQCM